jgi:uncharacterized protein YgbK (DUF1537 family)
VIALADVRQGVERVSKLLEQFGDGCWLADAETDADLDVLAQSAMHVSVRLWCGSAGLATALARHLNATPAHIKPGSWRQANGPALVVAGSQHPATARQVEVAGQSGMTVLRPPAEFVHEDGGGAAVRLAQAASEHLSSGCGVVMTTAGLQCAGTAQRAIAARLVAVRLGAAVAYTLAHSPVGGLVLTGGDIAAAVCEALGATALWLEGEAQPGIAVGRLADGAFPGLPVATKAGGFGGEDALLSAVQQLAAGSHDAGSR